MHFKLIYNRIQIILKYLLNNIIKAVTHITSYLV
jgi:hypothetical protein